MRLVATRARESSESRRPSTSQTLSVRPSLPMRRPSWRVAVPSARLSRRPSKTLWQLMVRWKDRVTSK